METVFGENMEDDSSYTDLGDYDLDLYESEFDTDENVYDDEDEE